MAQDVRTRPTTQEPVALGEERPPPPGRPKRSARDVFVAMCVCLALWTLLFAPVLERNARSGPVGARRTVALAVLRPVTAISDGLGVTALADGALRALGRDPDVQAGGELDLPELELPPLPSLDPEAPAPTGAGDPQQPSGESDPTGGGRDGDGVEIEPIRTPSRDTPIRVAVVGDSLSQGLGASITRWFDADVTRVLSLGRQSTGLARQDFFNWPRAMREIGEKFRPHLIFVMFGTNDMQPQIGPDGGTIPVGSTAWVDAYRARAASFVREATSNGSRVVWVGLPIVDERRSWTFYRRLNAIYEEVASADPLATYVDAWDAFADADGDFTAFLRNERGVLQEMRAPDGLHFTPVGYDYLARLSIRQADAAFDVPERSVTFRF